MKFDNLRKIMSRGRHSRFWVALAIFVLAVSAGAFTGGPTVEAGATCTSYVNSPAHWGWGVDCAAATADLEAQLDAYVNNACSPDEPCNYSIVITDHCDNVPGRIPEIISGYARFRCRIDGPGGPSGP